MEKYIQHIPYILCVTALLSILAIIFFFILNIRLNRIVSKYNSFMKGLGDSDVENLMLTYLKELEELKNEVHTDTNTRIEKIENKLPHFAQHLGIVNYNAFDNIANEMSFSIAVLDERKNGFILTGIYSRDHSYVYSKEIKRGKPQRELSREEVEAMNKALNKFDNLR